MRGGEDSGVIRLEREASIKMRRKKDVGEARGIL
jgi:hypothetical protein